MNQKLKYFFAVSVGLFFILVGFYFWASSPNISFSNYNNTGEYDYESQVSNDSVLSVITYNIGYLSGMTNNLAVERPESLFRKI